MEPLNALAASQDALKTIYYVVVGMAITEALTRALLDKEQFLGMKLFTAGNLPAFLLLIGFLHTVLRFVHGASINLADSSAGGGKMLLDFVGFFFQASLFYAMALTVREPVAFTRSFVGLLIADVAWLVLLRLFLCGTFPRSDLDGWRATSCSVFCYS